MNMALLSRIIGVAMLWTSMASSAVCVGKNCDLLESVAAAKGIPLQVVLDEIQGNIIDPILDSQMKMATWENGTLEFTPSGAQDGVKVSVWGGTSWDLIPINGKIFNTGYSSEYYTGAMSLRGILEYPLSNKTNIIFNAGAWSGPTDYGLGIVRGNSSETTGKLGVGLRRYFFRNDLTSLYFSSGFIVGARRAKIEFDGSNIKIIMNDSKVFWQGVESYEETTYFLTTPAMIGGSLRLWDVTISADLGARLIGQTGETKVGKYGPVGPFFGTSGYYNIGVTSDRDITSIQAWPILRFGIEWMPTSGFSISGNWQPSIDKYPNQLSGGVGWQFLRDSSSTKSRSVNK